VTRSQADQRAVGWRASPAVPIAQNFFVGTGASDCLVAAKSDGVLYAETLTHVSIIDQRLSRSRVQPSITRHR
jgi:hypothetical protein